MSLLEVDECFDIEEATESSNMEWRKKSIVVSLLLYSFRNARINNKR